MWLNQARKPRSESFAGQSQISWPSLKVQVDACAGRVWIARRQNEKARRWAGLAIKQRVP